MKNHDSGGSFQGAHHRRAYKGPDQITVGETDFWTESLGVLQGERSAAMIDSSSACIKGEVWSGLCGDSPSVRTISDGMGALDSLPALAELVGKADHWKQFYEQIHRQN